MTGDCRSILPTPARWCDQTTPFSTVSTASAGMLAITKRSPRLPEKLFRRIRLISSWWRRVSAGMFMAVSASGPTTAILDQSVAGLEVLDPGVNVGVEHRRGAGRLVEVAGDDEAVAQRDHGRAVRAELQDAGRSAPCSSRPPARSGGRSRWRARWRRRWRPTAPAWSSAGRTGERRRRSPAPIPPGRRSPPPAGRGRARDPRGRGRRRRPAPGTRPPAPVIGKTFSAATLHSGCMMPSRRARRERRAGAPLTFRLGLHSVALTRRQRLADLWR